MVLEERALVLESVFVNGGQDGLQISSMGSGSFSFLMPR
jgi:hypothetical protein